MPTSFTVVPVEGSADGGDAAAERADAPGDPDGPGPDGCSPGERAHLPPGQRRRPDAAAGKEAAVGAEGASPTGCGAPLARRAPRPLRLHPS